MCLHCRAVYVRRYFAIFEDILEKRYRYGVKRPIRSVKQVSYRLFFMFKYLEKHFRDVPGTPRDRADELWELTLEYHRYLKQPEVCERRCYMVLRELKMLADWRNETIDLWYDAHEMNERNNAREVSDDER
jgi:hypothetical protein